MFPIDIDFSRLKEVLTYDPQAPMIFSSGIFLWLFAAFMRAAALTFSCWRWSRFATSCWRNGWTVPKDAGNAKGW